MTERLNARVGMAISPESECTSGVEAPKQALPAVPAALRDESTESDFDFLIRIAEDKTAQAGRLRRPTSVIPAVKKVGE